MRKMTELIGKRIRDYEIKTYIGAGGHGTVYKALNLSSETDVALKIMHTELLDDKTMVQRLLQEAEIISELEHPNIVPLIESWQDEDGIYIVMPWLSGGDLRNYINTGRTADPHILSRILTQICDALHVAHTIAIVHRDIKPENILLDEDGNAYLSDFGFAKRMDNSVAITTVGDVVGTASYLSPEQILGYDIGITTDIYALGIMIHEMLDGVHPYAEIRSRVKLMLQLVQGDLPELKNQYLSDSELEQINALIAQCTAKNPDERYTTVAKVAQDFAGIISKT